MIRVLFFVLLAFALSIGFMWLADIPDHLVIIFGGMRYEVTLLVAIFTIITIIAATMFLWWFVKTILRSPFIVRNYLQIRKRNRGHQALISGLIAAAAGDVETAKRMNKQVGKLLDAHQEPLIKLLEVQTAMLEGKHGNVRSNFEKMLEDPHTRLLGLRGLYLEAQRAGAYDAVQHYAEEALKLGSHIEWASSAILSQLSIKGDWDAALQLLDTRKTNQDFDKQMMKRERAALLTAKAIAIFDSNPTDAKLTAMEANRLAPDLVPAAVTAARALFRQGKLRKGERILEEIWQKKPHPEIAAAYIHARLSDHAQDRLKRARYLFSLHPNNADSHLTLAHAAFDAGDYGLARENAKMMLAMAPCKSAYLLLADIEEAETGDIGRVKQWLAYAIKAPRDPIWIADGFMSELWLPISPVTGKLNAFEWKIPMEQIGQIIEETPQDGSASKPIIKTTPSIGQKQEIRQALQNSPALSSIVEDKKNMKFLIVDDPGVAEEERATHKQSRFRLF